MNVEEIKEHIAQVKEIEQEKNRRVGEIKKKLEPDQVNVNIGIKRIDRWFNYCAKCLLEEQGFKFGKQRLPDRSVIFKGKGGFLFKREFKHQYRRYIEFIDVYSSAEYSASSLSGNGEFDNLKPLLGVKFGELLTEVKKKIRFYNSRFVKKNEYGDREDKTIVFEKEIDFNGWVYDEKEVIIRKFEIQRKKGGSVFREENSLEYKLRFKTSNGESVDFDDFYNIMNDEFYEFILEKLKIIEEDKRKIMITKENAETKIAKLFDAAGYTQYTMAMELEKEDLKEEERLDSYRGELPDEET